MTNKLHNKTNTINSLILQPNPDDNKLTKTVNGTNEQEERMDISVVTEKPLTGPDPIIKTQSIPLQHRACTVCHTYDKCSRCTR